MDCECSAGCGPTKNAELNLIRDNNNLKCIYETKFVALVMLFCIILQPVLVFSVKKTKIRKRKRGVLFGRIIAVNAGHNRARKPHYLKNGDGVGTSTISSRRKMYFPGNFISIKKGPFYGVIRESDFTYDLARRIARHIRWLGGKCILTRVEPCVATPVGRHKNLLQRAARANRANAQLLLDLHGEWGFAGLRGYMLFAPCGKKWSFKWPYKHISSIKGRCSKARRSRRSLVFARSLHKKLNGFYRISKGIPPKRKNPIYLSRHKVIGFTKMPAVLLETGHMTDERDMDCLASAYYREDLAYILVQGMVEYFKRIDNKNS